MARQHEMLCSAFQDYNIENSKEWLDLQWNRQVLLMDYRPRVVRLANVTLFKAKELLPEYKIINESKNYWGEYLDNKLLVKHVPGNHETLLKEPNVKILGDSLNQSLECLGNSKDCLIYTP